MKYPQNVNGNAGNKCNIKFFKMVFSSENTQTWNTTWFDIINLGIQWQHSCFISKSVWRCALPTETDKALTRSLTITWQFSRRITVAVITKLLFREAEGHSVWSLSTTDSLTLAHHSVITVSVLHHMECFFRVFQLYTRPDVQCCFIIYSICPLLGAIQCVCLPLMIAHNNTNNGWCYIIQQLNAISIWPLVYCHFSLLN